MVNWLRVRWVWVPRRFSSHGLDSERRTIVKGVKEAGEKFRRWRSQLREKERSEVMGYFDLVFLFGT